MLTGGETIKYKKEQVCLQKEMISKTTGIHKKCLIRFCITKCKTCNIRVQELDISITKGHCHLRDGIRNIRRQLKVHCAIFLLPCSEPAKLSVITIIGKQHLWSYHDDFSIHTKNLAIVTNRSINYRHPKATKYTICPILNQKFLQTIPSAISPNKR